MKVRRIVLPLVAVLLAISLSNCVSVIKTADEPKVPVTFSSAKAAQTFYEKTYVIPSRGEDGGMVNMSLPIVLPSYRETKGSQLRFNEAVRAADTNGDQHITTSEAQVYAGDKAEEK